jgi:hypothetical protein
MTSQKRKTRSFRTTCNTIQLPGSPVFHAKRQSVNEKVSPTSHPFRGSRNLSKIVLKTTATMGKLLPKPQEAERNSSYLYLSLPKERKKG